MKILTVEALEIDPIHIKYECPHCFNLGNKIIFTKFKKNGKRYLTLKPNYHFHGSGGDLTNRIEDRITHCLIENPDYDLVNIVINDNTRRKTK